MLEDAADDFWSSSDDDNYLRPKPKKKPAAKHDPSDPFDIDISTIPDDIPLDFGSNSYSNSSRYGRPDTAPAASPAASVSVSSSGSGSGPARTPTAAATGAPPAGGKKKRKIRPPTAGEPQGKTPTATGKKTVPSPEVIQTVLPVQLFLPP